MLTFAKHERSIADVNVVRQAEKDAIGHRGMRFRHGCAIADVKEQELVAGAR